MQQAQGIHNIFFIDFIWLKLELKESLMKTQEHNM